MHGLCDYIIWPDFTGSESFGGFTGEPMTNQSSTLNIQPKNIFQNASMDFLIQTNKWWIKNRWFFLAVRESAMNKMFKSWYLIIIII